MQNTTAVDYALLSTSQTLKPMKSYEQQLVSFNTWIFQFPSPEARYGSADIHKYPSTVQTDCVDYIIPRTALKVLRRTECILERPTPPCKVLLPTRKVHKQYKFTRLVAATVTIITIIAIIISSSIMKTNETIRTTATLVKTANKQPCYYTLILDTAEAKKRKGARTSSSASITHYIPTTLSNFPASMLHMILDPSAAYWPNMENRTNMNKQRKPTAHLDVISTLKIPEVPHSRNTPNLRNTQHISESYT